MTKIKTITTTITVSAPVGSWGHSTGSPLIVQLAAAKAKIEKSVKKANTKIVRKYFAMLEIKLLTI
jgi:hypothetical protein